MKRATKMQPETMKRPRSEKGILVIHWIIVNLYEHKILPPGVCLKTFFAFFKILLEEDSVLKLSLRLSFESHLNREVIWCLDDPCLCNITAI